MSTPQVADMTVGDFVAAFSEALELVAAMVDPDPCWFDHHGGCQAHGYLEPPPGFVCPHARAKRLLDRIAP